MATQSPIPLQGLKTPLLDRYTAAARAAGCSLEQMRRFWNAGVVLQPRQLAAAAAARLCDEPGGPAEIGYGGARGGGKSHFLVAQMAVDDCQRAPGLKCLLLRKVGKANQESFEDLRRRLLGQVPHRHNQQRGILSFPNGSRIVLGHFQNESDVDAYLGLEYDVIGVEEATTLTFSKYKNIRTCCRSSRSGWQPRMYSTTNPGGVGHAWYKNHFITPFRQELETVTRFVPATADDNRFLNRDYIRNTLDTLVGWQLKAWRYGDWDIAAGQYFTNWRAQVDGRPHHVIPPFDIPRGWRCWISLDYGFTHYTTCYLLAQDGDGNLYLVDEHGERGWLPQRHAPAIHAMLARHGLAAGTLWRQVAGPDLFAKKAPQEGGMTLAETYERLGLKFESANDDRVNGAAEILNRLGDCESDPPIAPRLFVFERCARLIETLPALEHDPHRPEDVLKVDCDDEGLGGDDWYDGARYGVMAAWTPPGGWAQKPEVLAALRTAPAKTTDPEPEPQLDPPPAPPTFLKVPTR